MKHHQTSTGQFNFGFVFLWMLNSKCWQKAREFAGRWRKKKYARASTGWFSFELKTKICEANMNRVSEVLIGSAANSSNAQVIITFN